MVALEAEDVPLVVELMPLHLFLAVEVDVVAVAAEEADAQEVR